MARGYSVPDVRRRLIEALSDQDASSGVSGVELSRMLDISRTTMAKYLKMLAAEGTLRQKEVGNITLWSLEPGQESFTFPDDYFKAASAYMECIKAASEYDALLLVRNCMRSGGSAVYVILEVIMPASDAIREMYAAGKMGAAEQSMLHHIMYNSLSALEAHGTMPAADPKKSVVVAAADARSELVARAASAAYRSKGWSVFELGDVSATAGVLFDMDFQRLVDKVWRGNRRGLLITAAFSHTAEGLNFFADSLYPAIKRSRRMRLLLCGCRLEDPSQNIKSCDYYVNDDVSKILQWSDAASDGS